MSNKYNADIAYDELPMFDEFDEDSSGDLFKMINDNWFGITWCTSEEAPGPRAGLDSEWLIDESAELTLPKAVVANLLSELILTARLMPNSGFQKIRRYECTPHSFGKQRECFLAEEHYGLTSLRRCMSSIIYVSGRRDKVCGIIAGRNVNAPLTLTKSEGLC